MNINRRIQVVSLGVATLFLTLSFLSINHVKASESLRGQTLISIELNGVSFREALDSIADELHVNVTFIGEEPTEKRNIRLESVNFLKALAQVMRLYQIENHAVAYRADTNTITIARLGKSFLQLGSDIATDENIGNNVIAFDLFSDEHFLSMHSESDAPFVQLDRNSFLAMRSNATAEIITLSTEEFSAMTFESEYFYEMDENNWFALEYRPNVFFPSLEAEQFNKLLDVN